MRRLTAVAMMLASAACHPAEGQEWRTVNVSRQLHDSAEHHVRVHYKAGRLDVRSAAPGSRSLYEMWLRYDEQHARAVHRWAPDSRMLTLGLEGHSSFRGGRHPEGEMRLVLSPNVPLDLSLELGSVRARLDLGGLALKTLRLRAGASEARITFAMPNPGVMHVLSIEAGAASIRAEQLANANAGVVHVGAAAGTVELDFGGSWQRDVVVDARVAVGNVTVRVPRDVGIRVEHTRTLGAFRHEDLVRRGEAYYSANWDAAPHHLTVRAGTTLGRLAIDRVTY